MADDRNQKDLNANDPDRKNIKSEGSRVFGKGMTSPDSTQVPLKAETGEPDLDALKGKKLPDSDEDENVSRR